MNSPGDPASSCLEKITCRNTTAMMINPLRISTERSLFTDSPPYTNTHIIKMGIKRTISLAVENLINVSIDDHP